MKKNICAALVIGGLIFGSYPVYGQTIATMTQNNTTLVQLKVIGEGLGANVAYDSTTKKISVVKKDIKIEFTPDSNIATVNGKDFSLLAPAKIVKGSSYVPVRFISETLGGQIELKGSTLIVSLDGEKKEWQVQANVSPTTPVVSTSKFANYTKTIQGKTVKYVVIDTRGQNIIPSVQTAQGKINKVQSVGALAKSVGGGLAINGTYFDAYNGMMPLPNGTVVKSKETLYITDLGMTVGFTAEGKMFIDFVKTRVQGYKNGAKAWVTYRVNRPSPADPSATVIYTKEYDGSVELGGNTAVVCQDNYVIGKTTLARAVPANGFLLVMNGARANHFEIGDHVSYETVFAPQTDTTQEWSEVIHAISAGPSLLKNGEETPNPSQEGFSEAKILTQIAQRSFIGTMGDGRSIVGTAVASIADLKKIAKALDLQNAMCLDGGGSSALYLGSNYLTGPGRDVNNAIIFTQTK